MKVGKCNKSCFLPKFHFIDKKLMLRVGHCSTSVYYVTPKVVHVVLILEKFLKPKNKSKDTFYAGFISIYDYI